MQGVQVKLLSLDNACYTWAPQRCCMWRCYTNLLPLPFFTLIGYVIVICQVISHYCWSSSRKSQYAEKWYTLVKGVKN